MQPSNSCAGYRLCGPAMGSPRRPDPEALPRLGGIRSSRYLPHLSPPVRQLINSVSNDSVAVQVIPNACRSAPGSSPVPILAALPLHGDGGRVLGLDPGGVRPRAVGRVDLLRDDAFRTKPAGVREH